MISLSIDLSPELLKTLSELKTPEEIEEAIKTIVQPGHLEVLITMFSEKFTEGLPIDGAHMTIISSEDEDLVKVFDEIMENATPEQEETPEKKSIPDNVSIH